MTAPLMIPAIAEDDSLYPIEKMAAHQAGVPHLAVSIFVFWRGALLIQKRAADKYHCGNLWANTCCSHPHWGEPVEEAAHRRLKEELGFTVPLQPGQTFSYRAEVGAGLIENERVFPFWADLSDQPDVTPNPDEVAEVRWATVAKLLEELRQQRHEFAPWFQLYLENWDALGLKPKDTV